MDDTKEAIFKRQTRVREEEKRQKRLYERYAQARRAHLDQEWQAVVDIFTQIHSEDPAYPDPEGLLVSARESALSALFDQGLRHMEAEEWTQARQCLKELQRLEPGHWQTERLLSRISHELAKPLTVEVPDVSGENTSQASSTLDNRGLKLGAQNKALSETIPEGGIIRQSPEAGTEAEAGSSVSVTVSSGPSTVVPDVSGKNLEEAERVLSSAGLVLEGSQTQKRREQAGTVISTDPPAGSEIDVGISVTPIVSSGPSVPAANPDVLPSRRRPKPDFLPGRKPKPK